MSKKVGFLKETASQSTGEIGYMGEIDIANVTGDISLSPLDKAARRTENHPHYDLMLKTRHGWKKWGAAWLKTPQNGGAEFLSITVDHELMPKEIYVTAFPPSEEADGDRWNIVWGRPRGGNVAAGASSQQGLDDEIPY